MKAIKIFETILLSSLFTVSMLFTSCKKTEVEPVVIVDDTTVVEQPTVALTDEEIQDLRFLREEEKLARDVYAYAATKYSTMIFSNISNSEQTHMDNILILLNKYSIDDPATELAGEFSNATLQNLYNQLVVKVDSSLVDALIVGATIEDLDINDLKLNIDRTDKVDLLEVYYLLECGSRNHMRSFYKKLTMEGADYQSQYISDAEFQSIINSDKENCN
jgi:hypothetical protein